MPNNHARVSIVRGDQGSGKTNTLVGLIVDKARATVKAIQSPTGKIYPVTPYNGEQVIIKGKDGKGKIITIPKDFIIIPRTKIFVNFHLYGIQYVYCSFYDMFKWLNDNVIIDGILGVDESYIQLESRRGSSTANVTFMGFMMQIRKRQLELYLLTQHGRFIDWRSKWVSTREITCRFDEKTKRVHLIMKDMRRNKEKVISYWAPQYWRFYDTEELPELPQQQINKALSKLS